MSYIINIILSDPRWSISAGIAILGLIFTIWRSVLNRKRLTMEVNTFENKKSKFSLYLEDSFRTKSNTDENNKFILFHIRITNHAISKNSFTANLEVLYSNMDNRTMTLKLKHNSSYFGAINHKNLTEFETDIRVEENEIKTGWLIFNSPSHLDKVRIKKFTIYIFDGSGNSAHVSSSLMKDIIYET